MQAPTPTSPAPVESTANPRRFQVLSIDGGGVRGIFVAAVLAALEDDLEIPVAASFDLIVGTSTGGIIALALGAGLNPTEILDFYLTQKDRIFPGQRLGWRMARHLLAAKYRPRPLERALREVFGDRLLCESRIPLVIPAYDLAESTVHLFKTPHHPRLRRDYRIPMWAVAMATTAAPTYFPAFRLPDEHSRLIDGGVWANNPAMVGVTEAVSMFGRELSELRVLSLGTTTSPRPRPTRLDNAGVLRWARGPGVVEVLLRGQSVGAFAQVQHLVGVENAHRLDPVAPEYASLDRCDARELIGKASHHSRLFSPTFQTVFAGYTPAPYAALRAANQKAGISNAGH
jgi:predicted acylesterase/phospholipase RssA